MDQNPHWETDWMADREKAFSDEKHKQIQIEIQKQKEETPSSKPKKSKKAKKAKKKSKKRKTKGSNSSSSSDSESNEDEANGVPVIEDNSKSIRVAMRNKGKNSTSSGHNEDNNYGILACMFIYLFFYLNNFSLLRLIQELFVLINTYKNP